MPNPVADLRRGWTLPGDTVPVRFSSHAIARAGERLAPALTGDALQHALYRLIASTRVTRVAPGWIARPGRADAWLLLGEDLACPLHWRDGELHAATVMFRGSVSPKARDYRRGRRRAHSARKRGAKRGVSRRAHPGPTADDWPDGTQPASEQENE